MNLKSTQEHVVPTTGIGSINPRINQWFDHMLNTYLVKTKSAAPPSSGSKPTMQVQQSSTWPRSKVIMEFGLETELNEYKQIGGKTRKENEWEQVRPTYCKEMRATSRHITRTTRSRSSCNANGIADEEIFLLLPTLQGWADTIQHSLKRIERMSKRWNKTLNRWNLCGEGKS